MPNSGWFMRFLSPFSHKGASVPETEQYMYTKGRFLRGDVLCGYLFKRQSLALAVSLQAAPITPFPHSHNPLPLPAQMGSLNPEEENIS